MEDYKYIELLKLNDPDNPALDEVDALVRGISDFDRNPSSYDDAITDIKFALQGKVSKVGVLPSVDWDIDWDPSPVGEPPVNTFEDLIYYGTIGLGIAGGTVIIFFLFRFVKNRQ